MEKLCFSDEGKVRVKKLDERCGGNGRLELIDANAIWLTFQSFKEDPVYGSTHGDSFYAALTLS